ncbi:metal ABC transporter permease [Corynebacterium sp. TAE3-ERU12]|uniref:metal ABC transporter permease n=1 Tax=Corynebacterium sp. TAE3-ERU12 TaxID=2849491 RepID=UPI001C442C91|nr:metal ABC transporter permease [Corynebacterium sp. TAE3-ERU12]MBV7295919.1 metal ABC transporter permease [Corynebacterium sp. TAE3-ERU12]
MTLLEFISEFTYRRTVIGTSVIGLSAGVLGCHLYLRRQSMLADVVGHSAVAGVMGAFLIAAALAVDGRSMGAIIIGALVSGVLAVALTNWVAGVSRVSDDSSMAVALALFFGGGMTLLHIIKQSSLPNKGGIAELMFGNASTMTNADNKILAAVSAVVLIGAIVLHRQFSMVLFDPVLAKVSMNPRTVNALSLVQMALIVISVVLGIKAVGLILILAFSIFPAAAARQWTKSLVTMMPLAGVFGAVGGVVGSWAAVTLGNVPTGPAIVLVLSIIVFFSIIFAPRRGLISRAFRSRKSSRTQDQEGKVTVA